MSNHLLVTPQPAEGVGLPYKPAGGVKPFFQENMTHAISPNISGCMSVVEAPKQALLIDSRHFTKMEDTGQSVAEITFSSVEPTSFFPYQHCWIGVIRYISGKS